MFEKKFPWSEVTIAFLLGAATGAVAALLLAPTSGKKLQKQLRNVVEDQVDNVEKMVGNVEKIVRKVVNV